MIKYYELQDFYNILYYSNINEKDKLSIYIPKNLYTFWFSNKQYWFSHSYINEWKMEWKKYNNSINEKVSLILLYDQLFRHPSKYKKEIEKNKTLAFRFSTQLSLQILHSKDYYNLTSNEKIFILLSIRHNNNLTLKFFVLQKIYQELKQNETDKIWLRFLNATILDIDSFKKNNIGFNHETIKNKLDYYINSFQTIIVNNNINQNCKILNCIKQNSWFELYVKKKYNQLIDKLTTKQKINKIAVSISGGVDSMVCSQLLNDICKEKKIEMILVHICYNNRQTSMKEKDLLVYWSYLLDCKLYIRNIDEIQRSRHSLLRNTYETITRKIRFSFYEYFNCPIVLGHNRDDTFENIFSNLSKKIHFDNLFGMNELSHEGNIIILRPLLSFNKSDILSYANEANILYLEDSTPKWSRRGKTRDVLIPCIKKFDTNILNGIEEHAKYTKFLEEQWRQMFITWFYKNITRGEYLTENNTITNKNNTIEIKRDNFFETNYINVSFWIKVWFSLELDTRPSNKSILNLIQTIGRNRFIRCDLNKKYKVEIQKYFIIVLLV